MNRTHQLSDAGKESKTKLNRPTVLTNLPTVHRSDPLRPEFGAEHLFNFLDGVTVPAIVAISRFKNTAFFFHSLRRGDEPTCNICPSSRSHDRSAGSEVSHETGMSCDPVAATEPIDLLAADTNQWTPRVNWRKRPQNRPLTNRCFPFP